MFATSGSMPSLPELSEQIHAALKLWQEHDSAVAPLAHLYLFQHARREHPGSVRQATNKVLQDGLKALHTVLPQDADLLRKRFIERIAVHVVANQLHVHESWVYQLQKNAIGRLAEVVQAAETAARTARETTLESRLGPPGQAGLVGIETHLAALSKILAAPGPPWLISIEGLGGIGKTSLADALLRRLAGDASIDDIGWVSARQQVFQPGGPIQPVERPALTTEALIEALVAQLLEDAALSASLSVEQGMAALQARLKASPHLIVIDNLETVTDVATLLPALRRLANPGKFLLTSRHSLYAEPDIYRFVVSELNESDALELVRQEAHLRNVPALAAARPDELRPIFETVGGNPLALRLVVGQAHVHALGAILGDLAAARGKKAENLYWYIYRQAWEDLDEQTRGVFVAMPLVAGRGGSLEELADITGMEPATLGDALEILVARNLVDSRGGLTDRLYSIHALTRTFLHEQVVKWQ